MSAGSSSSEAIRSAMYGAIVGIGRGVDRGDRDLILSGYHPDAIDDPGVYRGTAEGFADWVIALTEGMTFMQHGVESCNVLALEEDAAATETYYSTRTVGTDGGGALSFGRHLDHFEKRSGKWLIGRRLTRLEFTTPNLGYPNEGCEKGGRDSSDPSYALVEAVERAPRSRPARGNAS